MKWDKGVSTVVATLGVIANHLWGGLDKMLLALLTLMALDLFAGILCGGKENNIDSEVAFSGITKKKMMVLVMIAVGTTLDNIIGADGAARSATIYFYIAMEGISIFENAGRLGFPMPDWLRDKFSQLQEHNGKLGD